MFLSSFVRGLQAPVHGPYAVAELVRCRATRTERCDNVEIGDPLKWWKEREKSLHLILFKRYDFSGAGCSRGFGPSFLDREVGDSRQAKQAACGLTSSMVDGLWYFVGGMKLKDWQEDFSHALLVAASLFARAWFCVGSEESRSRALSLTSTRVRYSGIAGRRKMNMCIF